MKEAAGSHLPSSGLSAFEVFVCQYNLEGRKMA